MTTTSPWESTPKLLSTSLPLTVNFTKPERNPLTTLTSPLSRMAAANEITRSQHWRRGGSHDGGHSKGPFLWEAASAGNCLEDSWQPMLLESIQRCSETLSIHWAGICADLMGKVAGQAVLPLSLQQADVSCKVAACKGQTDDQAKAPCHQGSLACSTRGSRHSSCCLACMQYKQFC